MKYIFVVDVIALLLLTHIVVYAFTGYSPVTLSKYDADLRAPILTLIHSLGIIAPFIFRASLR